MNCHGVRVVLAFLLKVFAEHRMCIRIVRFWRSRWDVLHVFRVRATCDFLATDSKAFGRAVPFCTGHVRAINPEKGRVVDVRTETIFNRRQTSTGVSVVNWTRFLSLTLRRS